MSDGVQRVVDGVFLVIARRPVARGLKRDLREALPPDRRVGRFGRFVARLLVAVAGIGHAALQALGVIRGLPHALGISKRSRY